MSAMERPRLPPGYDSSRARERAADPAGWRFSAAERDAVRRVIAERRDIRRFRPDPLPVEILHRLLDAAHQAPSVGLMQPTRFVVIQDDSTKAAVQSLVARERLVQGRFLDARSHAFLDLKVEGIREAPVNICVCCDRGSEEEILGRHTIRDTDLYSTACAVENLWLAARAEGVGVGWVSFYQPDDMRRVLGLPAQVEPVAYLCLGYPDERPERPGLEIVGWGHRRPLEPLVFAERWGAPFFAAAPAGEDGSVVTEEPPATPPSGTTPLPDWWRALADRIVPADPAAAVRARDRSDELAKPAGSLGALEHLIERWAAATGTPPPGSPHAGVLVFAADHGVSRSGVSLFSQEVSAQVAKAAARGGTAIGVLARAHGAELVVADIGLVGPRVDGVIDRRVADGSADFTRGPALDLVQLRATIEAGYALAADLATRCDVLLLGEIGIGNTTVASALLCALTGIPLEEACGRGTGLDAQGLARKQRVVRSALAMNVVGRSAPLECLRRVGGLEFGALVGAMLAAATAHRPVLLDGFATGVAALVACRLAPAVRDYLIAGHRSAEPGHERVLVELGLEPLLDLRLRLGEGSGAALAFPLIGLAGRLHAEMLRFDDAGVSRVRG